MKSAALAAPQLPLVVISPSARPVDSLPHGCREKIETSLCVTAVLPCFTKSSSTAPTSGSMCCNGKSR